jgi:hypothetical protein
MAASGCRLDGQDYDGRTPLHVATSEGQLHVVKFLVSKGVALNVLDRWGGTPLSDALRHGHTHVAAFLQSKGAVLGNSNAARDFSFSKIDGNLTPSAMAANAHNTTAYNTTATGGGTANTTGAAQVLTPRGMNASAALALAGIRKTQFQVNNLQREGGFTPRGTAVATGTPTATTGEGRRSYTQSTFQYPGASSYASVSSSQAALPPATAATVAASMALPIAITVASPPSASPPSVSPPSAGAIFPPPPHTPITYIPTAVGVATTNLGSSVAATPISEFLASASPSVLVPSPSLVIGAAVSAPTHHH